MMSSFIKAREAWAVASSFRLAEQVYKQIHETAKTTGLYFLEVDELPKEVVERLKSDGYKVQEARAIVPKSTRGIGYDEDGPDEYKKTHIIRWSD